MHVHTLVALLGPVTIGRSGSPCEYMGCLLDMSDRGWETPASNK